MCSLVLCNPLLSNSGKRSPNLLPEVYMKRIFNIFGDDTPFVLFAPLEFLLDQRTKSTRLASMRDMKAKITLEFSRIGRREGKHRIKFGKERITGEERGEFIGELRSWRPSSDGPIEFSAFFC